jgi:hypothetical protein
MISPCREWIRHFLPAVLRKKQALVALVQSIARWSKAIAIGNLNLVEKVKSKLGFKAAHREVIKGGRTYALRSKVNLAGNFGGKMRLYARKN